MQRYLISFITILFFSVSSSHAGHLTPPGKGWVKTKAKEEFAIYYRDTKDGNTREVVLMGVIQATPEKCFQVVGEYENYPEFMPYVKYSKIVNKQKIDNLKSIFHVFFILEPPLVSTRYYTLELINEKNPAGHKGAYRSKWNQEVGQHKKTPADYNMNQYKGIEIKFNTGYWFFKPLNHGRQTQVTYYLWTNPGGKIPIWIVNKANTISLPDLWESIKKRVGEK